MFLTINKLWRKVKRIVIRNVDQISIESLITQNLILNFANISIFQVEATVYVKSSQSKLLKVVINNSLTIGLQRSLTCKNSYSDISWYSWQTRLIAKHCSQKTFPFLSVSNGPTPTLSNISVTLRKSHETIFVGYFWIITNTCKRCFWGVSEMSQYRHLSRDVFETS